VAWRTELAVSLKALLVDEPAMWSRSPFPAEEEGWRESTDLQISLRWSSVIGILSTNKMD
jgi:hypothetical protein